MSTCPPLAIVESRPVSSEGTASSTTHVPVVSTRGAFVNRPDEGGDLVVTSAPAMAYKVLTLRGIAQILSIEEPGKMSYSL